MIVVADFDLGYAFGVALEMMTAWEGELLLLLVVEADFDFAFEIAAAVT